MEVVVVSERRTSRAIAAALAAQTRAEFRLTHIDERIVEDIVLGLLMDPRQRRERLQTLQRDVVPRQGPNAQRIYLAAIRALSPDVIGQVTAHLSAAEIEAFELSTEAVRRDPIFLLAGPILRWFIPRQDRPLVERDMDEQLESEADQLGRQRARARFLVRACENVAWFAWFQAASRARKTFLGR